MVQLRRRLWLSIIGCVLGSATGVAAMDLDGFGRCLSSKRATFYGASWCPHCRAQRETLGDAMKHVRYVECALPGDPKSSAFACKEANVHSYPTWTFADGSRKSGETSLDYLAAKTGCELPAGVAPVSPTKRERSATTAPPHPRTKIIEVR